MQVSRTSGSPSGTPSGRGIAAQLFPELKLVSTKEYSLISSTRCDNIGPGAIDKDRGEIRQCYINFIIQQKEARNT